MARILLVTVNFKQYELTEKYLKNLLDLSKNGELVDIVLVDNCFDEELGNKLKASFKNIRIFLCNENLGYFGAIKYALSFYSPLAYDFVILCNNDIEITDPSFFLTLLETKFEGDIGIIAPDVKIKSNNKHQNPYINKWKWWYSFYYYFFYSSFIVHEMRNKLSRLKPIVKPSLIESSSTNIFAAHGSFIILTSQFFSFGGNLEYPSFLYFEEEFLAIQCKKLNLKTVYFPILSVIHDENQTTNGNNEYFKYKQRKISYKLILK